MPKTEVSKLTGKTVKAGGNRTGVPSGPNAKKTGPKPIEINWPQVETLAAIYCTIGEICSYLGISHDTLAYRCEREHGKTLKEYIGSCRDKGKANLRKAQYQTAVTKGNVQMQIWLGKQLLGQSEKIENYEAPQPIIIRRRNGETIELSASKQIGVLDDGDNSGDRE